MLPTIHVMKGIKDLLEQFYILADRPQAQYATRPHTRETVTVRASCQRHACSMSCLKDGKTSAMQTPGKLLPSCGCSCLQLVEHCLKVGSAASTAGASLSLRVRLCEGAATERQQSGACQARVKHL